MLSRVARGIAVLAFSAIALAGCGDDGGDGGSAGGEDRLTVYSSLPHSRTSADDAEGIENGIRLALDQRDGRAGRFALRYEPLDSAGPGGDGSWDPRRVEANARRAADDESAIGYIGELQSGATALALPILARAGLPTVSPSNTAVGLTVDEASAAPGEPERYYPTGERSFVRVVPRDTIQGAALARLMREERCRRAFILHDPAYYGRGLATTVAKGAQREGVTIAGTEQIAPRAADYTALARRIARAGATCIVFAGDTDSNAVRLFEDLAREVPDARLFGGDGVAQAAFTDPARGGLDPLVAARVMVTVPTLPPDFYPPRGQRFFRDYARRYGGPAPSPYAIYGYEAMSLLMDAVAAAGGAGDDRQAVTEQLFLVEDRDGAIGVYDIDENGDTTLDEYGAYRIAGGRLAFDRLLSAQN